MLVEYFGQQQMLQRYLVHNRYQPELEINPDLFSDQTIICLPTLPSCIPPLTRVKYAANLLFDSFGYVQFLELIDPNAEDFFLRCWALGLTLDRAKAQQRFFLCLNL